MNIVSLVGRLTKNVELKSTSTGKNVAQFTLAVDRYGKGADFIPCVAWNRAAELLSQYTKKGDKVGVEGSIQTDSYESNGKKIYTVKVAVDTIEFLSNKHEANEAFDTVDDLVDFKANSDDLPF